MENILNSIINTAYSEIDNTTNKTNYELPKSKIDYDKKFYLRIDEDNFIIVDCTLNKIESNDVAISKIVADYLLDTFNVKYNHNPISIDYISTIEEINKYILHEEIKPLIIEPSAANETRELWLIIEQLGKAISNIQDKLTKDKGEI